MEDSTQSYRIKDIKFFGSARRVLLQSANGPCPLLALCNVLLLRNQLQISEDQRYISFNELIEMVSNLLFELNGRSGDLGQTTSSRDANIQESLSSCLNILPKLNAGLDVNCKFCGPTDFEYTQELAVFDLLDISLFHGWIVSKQDEAAYAAFGDLSYNQVIEKLIALEEARSTEETRQVAVAEGREPPEEAPEEAGRRARDIETGLCIKDFMDRTASQLSYEGLLALHETVRERQLAVFFRNSHFSTMLKHNGDVYLLCTDIAFGASHVCWEKLDEVDGDTSYYDADFRENTAADGDAAAQAAAEALQEQAFARLGPGVPESDLGADADALFAMQLQQQEAFAAQQAGAAAQQRYNELQAWQQQAQLDAVAQQQAALAQQQAQAGARQPQQQGAPPAEPAAPAAKGKAKKKKSPKSCVLQ